MKHRKRMYNSKYMTQKQVFCLAVCVAYELKHIYHKKMCVILVVSYESKISACAWTYTCTHARIYTRICSDRCIHLIKHNTCTISYPILPACFSISSLMSSLLTHACISTCTQAAALPPIPPPCFLSLQSCRLFSHGRAVCRFLSV